MSVVSHTAPLELRHDRPPQRRRSTQLPECSSSIRFGRQETVTGYTMEVKAEHNNSFDSRINVNQSSVSAAPCCHAQPLGSKIPCLDLWPSHMQAFKLTPWLA
ncbi:hypothetical protein B5807_11209 [Epicoccum nigrum]|uniref:Uncharacterized protein n=1 Tax=Epicoccum nigrum TaxID=105696 RepID=A0A1Y2LME6_EPING|nr:hypothetical protein B5807_11209 [Epicoccum nigrum]